MYVLFVSIDPLVAVGVAGFLSGALLAWRVYRGGPSDVAESRDAHDAAQEREPPVSIGETHEMGITEFADHHSGERVAVGKVEGFVVFTENVPDGVGVGDVIRGTITSFNEGRTSADATFADSG